MSGMGDKNTALERLELAQCLPVWERLSIQDRQQLASAAVLRSAKPGELVHSGEADCLGLLAIRQGQLRAFILSEQGREVTLYRLFSGDICLFSAACVIKNLQFDLMIRPRRTPCSGSSLLRSTSRSPSDPPPWQTTPAR